MMTTRTDTMRLRKVKMRTVGGGAWSGSNFQIVPRLQGWKKWQEHWDQKPYSVK